MQLDEQGRRRGAFERPRPHAAERGQRPRQLDPRRGDSNGAPLCDEAHRPRLRDDGGPRLGSPGRDHMPAARLAAPAAGWSRPAPRSRRTRASAVLAPLRSPSAAQGTDQQIESGGAIGSVVRWHPPKVPRRLLGGRARIAPIEREFGASERANGWPRPDRTAPPLPPAVPGGGEARASRTSASAVIAGRVAASSSVAADQFLFGFEPRAAPHADRGVLRAAHGEQRAQAPFRTKHLEPRAPLDRALVVAHALAGGDHVAARQRRSRRDRAFRRRPLRR